MHQNILTDVDCYCDGTDSYCDCEFYNVDDRDREISYNNPIRYRSYYYDVELSFTSITDRTSLTSLTRNNEKHNKNRAKLHRI